MAQIPSTQAPIRVVRFTRRFARQCALKGRRLCDRDACDAIANGSRRVVRRRGSRGGPVILFEGKVRAPGAGAGPVRVLAELTRGGCVALAVVPPGPGAEKSLKYRDF